MIWATEYKHVDLVKLLLSKGSDINIRDNVSVNAGAGNPAGRPALESTRFCGYYLCQPIAGTREPWASPAPGQVEVPP